MTRPKPPDAAAPPRGGAASDATDAGAATPAPPSEPAPDYLSDFPEEFEQRPGGPPRDLARRGRRSGDGAEPGAEDAPGDGADESAAAAKVRAMRQRIEKLRD